MSFISFIQNSSDVPAPGTYDYNNFAIAKAVIQEEDDENSEFKPIRSTLSQAPRFTELKKGITIISVYKDV